MKKLLLIILLLIVSAMSMRAEFVIGRVIDSETKQPIASVDIDSKMIRNSRGYQLAEISSDGKRFVQTDSLGRFRLACFEGAYSIIFMQIGYKNVSRNLICKGSFTEKDTVNLGDIELKMSKALLKEVTITGHRKKFYLHGDTVIYDPLAFNLKEGDRIERLLQKLPGVDRTEDGQLMWMGKPLRMIVNGQDNNIVANFLPNIAVEAVDNIKLYKRRNGRDSLKHLDGEQVLDVKIKREWMEKWYGDASLMGQTPHYYDANANAYRLSDKVPVYIYGRIGDGNHYYYPGFHGSKGLMNINRNSRMKGHRLGFNVSKTKDIITRDDYKSRSIETTPDLSHEDNLANGSGKSEQYLNSGTTYSESRNSSYSHSLRFAPIDIRGHYMKYGFGITYSAQMQYERTSSDREASGATFSASPYRFSTNPLDMLDKTGAIGDSLRHNAVNSNRHASTSVSDRYSSRMRVDFNYSFKNRSQLNAQFSLDYSDGTNKSYSLRNTKYYKETPSSTIDKQYSTAPTRMFTANLSESYQRSIFESRNRLSRSEYDKATSLIATITNNTEYQRNYSNNQVYRWIMNDLKPDDLMNQLQYLPSEYGEFLSALDTNNSTLRDSRTLSNASSLQLRFKYNKFSVSPSYTLKIEEEHLDYKRGVIDTTATRTSIIPKVGLKIQYQIAKATSIDLTNAYHTSNPDMVRQMAYVDDTNPLYITEGNPLLRKTRQLRTALGFSSTIAKHQMMMSAVLAYTSNFNAYSSVTLYDPATGVYRSKEDNVRGGYSYYAEYNFEWMFAPKFSLKNMSRLDWSKRYSILNAEITSPQQVLNAQRGRQVTNNLSFTYLGNNLELTTKVNLTNQNWRNSAGRGNNYNYWNYTFGFQSRYTVANKWILNLALDYQGRDGYMSDIMNKDHLIVDASLDWKVMKNRGVFTLGASDVFNDYTNNYASVSANSRSESRNITLSHYYYAKFVYHFDGRKPKSAKGSAGSGTVQVIGGQAF